MLSYYLNNSLFFSNINVELRRKVINIFMSVIFLTIHSILKYYKISVKELEWIYCGDGICSIMLNHEIDKKNQVIIEKKIQLAEKQKVIEEFELNASLTKQIELESINKVKKVKKVKKIKKNKCKNEKIN